MWSSSQILWRLCSSDSERSGWKQLHQMSWFCPVEKLKEKNQRIRGAFLLHKAAAWLLSGLV